MAEDRTPNNPPQGAQSTVSGVSFVERLFGEWLPYAWIGHGRNWFGGLYNQETYGRFPADAGHYMSAALFGKTAKSRTIPEWKARILFVLDDVSRVGPVGKFVQKQWADKFLKPSWIMETSAGNFQYGFRLLPETDWRRWSYFDAMTRLHPDVGGSAQQGDPVHYYRLASGINPKNNFKVRLTQDYDGSEWALDDIAAALGIDMSEAAMAAWETSGGGTAGGAGSPGKRGSGETCSAETMQAILDALDPNDAKVFATHNNWIGIAHAVRDALGEAGRDIFLDWCKRYTGKTKTDDAAENMWDTLGDEHRNDLGTLRKLLIVAHGETSKVFADLHDRIADEQSALTPVDPDDPTLPPVGAVKTQIYTRDMFWFVVAEDKYVFPPTGELVAPAALDKVVAAVGTGQIQGGKGAKAGQEITIPASVWIARHRRVTHMSWLPGEPEVLKNQVVGVDGLEPHPAGGVYNLYRAPRVVAGDPALAGPWVSHVRLLYPGDAEHLFDCFAHRVQRPGDKINHGLLLGGAPGIGKDTLLAPVIAAVGEGNTEEITPSVLKSQFNGHLRAVLLRISELHDIGEVSQYAMYDTLKTVLVAPPAMLGVNEKFRRPYKVLNVVFVVLTSNARTDGIYLPPDDRRFYVAWSDQVGAGAEGALDKAYFDGLWGWLLNGGMGHVGAWLRARDLSKFAPKAPPFRTQAWHDIVAANRSSEDSKLADALDALGRPVVLTLEDLKVAGDLDLWNWIRDRANHRLIAKKMEGEGYRRVMNPTKTDGRWKIGGRDTVIYGDRMKPFNTQAEAIKKLNEAAKLKEKAAESGEPGPF